MREIIFRGKRLDNGQFIYGDIHRHATGKMFIKPNKKDCRYSAEIIPETIGQYTGLTSKNGTKIFEGDIVKSRIGTYVVKFLTGSWCCSLIEREYLTLLSIISVKEVIGNIHDNPELLESEVDNE